MICSFRDLSADKLLVTRDVTSRCGSSVEAVSEPGGCASTGVVDWLRRSSSMWSGAGGDISWYTMAIGGGTATDTLNKPK